MKQTIVLFLAVFTIDFIGNKIIITNDSGKKVICTADQKLIDSGDVDAIIKTMKCEK